MSALAQNLKVYVQWLRVGLEILGALVAITLGLVTLLEKLDIRLDVVSALRLKTAGVVAPDGYQVRESRITVVQPENEFQLRTKDSLKLTTQEIPFSVDSLYRDQYLYTYLNGESVRMTRGVPYPVPGTDCHVWWADSGEELDGHLFDLSC